MAGLLDFSGAPHGGEHWLLPEWESQGAITPTAIIDHSQVGSTLGTYWFFRDSTGVESHFSVRGRRSGDKDGQIIQFMSTDRRADANLAANGEAISIETEDDGDPNNQPWTQAQLDSLIWLHNRLVAVYPTIPRRKITTPWDAPRGLGYHSLPGINTAADPNVNPWTPALGKTCPGRPVRVAQWEQILLPAFIGGDVGGSDPLMADAQTIMDAINQLRTDLTVFGTTGLENTVESYAARIRNIEAKLGVAASTEASILATVKTVIDIVKAGDSDLSAAISDLRSALLGAIIAQPGMSEERAQQIVDGVIAGIEAEGVQVDPGPVLQALREHPLVPSA